MKESRPLTLGLVPIDSDLLNLSGAEGNDSNGEEDKECIVVHESIFPILFGVQLLFRIHPIRPCADIVEHDEGVAACSESEVIAIKEKESSSSLPIPSSQSR